MYNAIKKQIVYVKKPPYVFERIVLLDNSFKFLKPLFKQLTKTKTKNNCEK